MEEEESLFKAQRLSQEEEEGAAAMHCCRGSNWQILPAVFHNLPKYCRQHALHLATSVSNVFNFFEHDPTLQNCRPMVESKHMGHSEVARA